jgi:Cu+-exporting ATPase
MLGNFINSAAAVFTSPKVSQGPLFLEQDVKMAEEALLEEERNVKRVELKIGGMTVSLFENTSMVERELIAVWGVCSQHRRPDYVDDKGKAWDEARIAEEVEDVGFDAEVVEQGEIKQVELRIYG